MTDTNLLEDDLTPPAFLDLSDPEVRKERAEHFLKWREELAAASRLTMPKAVTKLAKSVTTDPASAPATRPVKSVATTPSAASPAKKTRAGKFADNMLITILINKFPHREGSQAEKKSGLFVDGMTVSEYKNSGNDLGFSGSWQLSHIRHCVEHGFIGLTSA